MYPSSKKENNVDKETSHCRIVPFKKKSRSENQTRKNAWEGTVKESIQPKGQREGKGRRVFANKNHKKMKLDSMTSPPLP